MLIVALLQNYFISKDEYMAFNCHKINKFLHSKETRYNVSDENIQHIQQVLD